ncbi:MAG: hypothetical protein ACRDK0_15540 [Solirubrobacteraceae bacterium]
MAELVVRADPADPQGIDVDSPIVREAVDHVSRNYGTLTAVGNLRGDQTQWTSRGNGAADVRRAVADPKTRDVSSNALRHELGDPTAEQELMDEAAAAINEMGRSVDEIDLFADDDAAA